MRLHGVMFHQILRPAVTQPSGAGHAIPTAGQPMAVEWWHPATGCEVTVNPIIRPVFNRVPDLNALHIVTRLQRPLVHIRAALAPNNRRGSVVKHSVVHGLHLTAVAAITL